MSRARRDPYRNRLVVMIKEPRAGRVKTRLARTDGVVAATRFMRVNARLTLRRLADPRWQVILAVAPDTAVDSSLLAAAPRLPQGGGDLGARMMRAMRRAQPGPVLVIGADIPGIRRSDVANAFRLLRGGDAVLGAAGDGGYWLAGLMPRALNAPIFDNVRWSGPHALADTRANLAGRRLAFAALKDDVDTAEDLKRLQPQASRLVLPVP